MTIRIIDFRDDRRGHLRLLIPQAIPSYNYPLVFRGVEKVAPFADVSVEEKSHMNARAKDGD
jgi:hypothetical protein